MIYRLDLNNEPFNWIKTKRKTIEMRIVKDNRKDMIPGDYIFFTNNKTGEEMKVVITFVHFYKDFEELYKYEDTKSLGYEENQKASYKDMFFYYKEEDIKRCGVMAIGVTLL